MIVFKKIAKQNTRRALSVALAALLIAAAVLTLILTSGFAPLKYIGSVSGDTVENMAEADASEAKAKIIDLLTNPMGGFEYKDTPKILTANTENIIYFGDVFSAINPVNSFYINMISISTPNNAMYGPDHWCTSTSYTPSFGGLQAPAVWSDKIALLKGPIDSEAYNNGTNYITAASDVMNTVEYSNITASSEMFRITPSGKWDGVRYFWIPAYKFGFNGGLTYIRVALQVQYANDAPTANGIIRNLAHKEIQTITLADVNAQDITGNGYTTLFYNVFSSDNAVCAVANNETTLVLNALKHGAATIYFNIINSNSGAREISTTYNINVTVAKAPLNIIAGLTYFGNVGAEQITVSISGLAIDPDGESMSISRVIYGNAGNDINYYTATIRGTDILLNFIKGMPKNFSTINNLTIYIKDSTGAMEYAVPVSVSSANVGEPLSERTMLFIEGGIAVFLFLVILFAMMSARRNKLGMQSYTASMNYLKNGGMNPQLQQGMSMQALPSGEQQAPVNIFLGAPSDYDANEYGDQYGNQQFFQEQPPQQFDQGFAQPFYQGGMDDMNGGLGNL